MEIGKEVSLIPVSRVGSLKGVEEIKADGLKVSVADAATLNSTECWYIVDTGEKEVACTIGKPGKVEKEGEDVGEPPTIIGKLVAIYKYSSPLLRSIA